MILLSSFMTVLCVDAAKGLVLHAPIGTELHGLPILKLDIPAIATAPFALPALPGLTLDPGASPGLVYVARTGYDLCVHPSRQAAFLRNQGEGRFPYFVLDDAALDDLRTLLAHRWYLDGSRVCTPVALEPFTVDFGAVSIDLTERLPVRTSGVHDAFVIPTESGHTTIRRADPKPCEILLRRRSASWYAPIVKSVATLHDTPTSRLVVPAETEMLALPVTVCADDHAWLHDKTYPYGSLYPITGRHRCQPVIARERHKFVMLARHAEGNIFDEHGFSTEFGYCLGFGVGGMRSLPMPAGMRQEDERLFLDGAMLDAAPRLTGPHIVFTTPSISNYFHFLIDGVLPLLALLAYAPKGAKVIMPGTLRDMHRDRPELCDHHDILRAVGLADVPVVELADPYVFVEDVYFLEHRFIHNMPVRWLHDLQARVMRDRKDSPRDLNLYVTRRTTRRVRNAAQIERFLAQREFTIVELENTPFDQQVEFFSRANVVIATHGAALSNLLFCQPGTKVLELLPDREYRPFFSYLSAKLGLIHGILPCITEDGSFDGDLTIDMRKFSALYRIIKNHL